RVNPANITVPISLKQATEPQIVFHYVSNPTQIGNTNSIPFLARDSLQFANNNNNSIVEQLSKYSPKLCIEEF
ncbi:hypothetical protein SFRURICE_016858, partial [Spodoptera frugiperda]